MMELDLDYEEVFWNGEPVSIVPDDVGAIKDILHSGLDDFLSRDVGVSGPRLARLWKIGLLRRYDAIKPYTRPETKWGLDSQNILYRLSDDPEICRLLQERARRKQPLVQADRFRGGTKFIDSRISRRVSERRRPY